MRYVLMGRNKNRKFNAENSEVRRVENKIVKIRILVFFLTLLIPLSELCALCVLCVKILGIGIKTQDAKAVERS
jgi:uncharacterized membrane protein YdjX (TVP38/TMEM64 family)